MRTYLIINPGSGNGRSRRLAELYTSLLRERDVRFSQGATGCLDDARHLTRQAIEAGYDRVVAVGGDGTINRVISGLFDSDQATSASAELGVLYAGTSPDFCRFHGIPTDPQAAVEQLIGGAVSTIDVCRMRHRTSTDREQYSYFASSANIGLGADIARRANRLRPFWGDTAGTLLATVATIVRARRHRVDLGLSPVNGGPEAQAAQVLNITVGKNPHIASGLKLEVDIAPADGRLYMFLIGGISRLSLIGALPSLYSGEIANDPRFSLHRVTRVRIDTAGRPLTTECDGDPAGWCPAEISILPQAVKLVGARVN